MAGLLRATGRRDSATERVPELATTVGLTPDLLGRRPHEVSDGQLQRACLARALVLRPRWLICDEMTAMRDASTTAVLVDVVEDYRRTTGAGLLAVGHDRTLLNRWCDRTLHWETLGAVSSTRPKSRAYWPCGPTFLPDVPCPERRRKPSAACQRPITPDVPERREGRRSGPACRR